MFSQPPTISLEVIYEHEDSFINRIQQQQQQNHRSNPFNNYQLSGSSPTAVAFNSMSSLYPHNHDVNENYEQRQAPEFQIKTVLKFPIDLFLEGTSKNLEKFKIIAAENFPFNEEQKMRQQFHRAPKNEAFIQKIIKKLYVCFPNENSATIIQPLKDYLNSGLYRSAQGLDKMEFLIHDEGQKQKEIYNRFYFVTHQLFAVYEDDLANYSFQERYGLQQNNNNSTSHHQSNNNNNSNLATYLADQRHRQEQVDKIRKDFKLLSLARPSGGEQIHNPPNPNGNNISLLSLSPSDHQSQQTIPPTTNPTNVLQPPHAINSFANTNQNEWEYLQKRYFSGSLTHADVEREKQVHKCCSCCTCNCHNNDVRNQHQKVPNNYYNSTNSSAVLMNSSNIQKNNNNINTSAVSWSDDVVDPHNTSVGRFPKNNSSKIIVPYIPTTTTNDAKSSSTTATTRSQSHHTRLIGRTATNGRGVIKFNLVNQTQQDEEQEEFSRLSTGRRY